MCSLSKIVFPALCLGLAAASVQAAGPTIRFEMDGEAMIITYTGTLYQSADGIHWEKAPYATSPYLAMTNDRQMFFCSGGQVPEPKPGEDFVALLPGGVELALAWIAPGSFIMGSPVDEVGRDMIYDETQHPVTLTKGFWMGQYEVTQAQYESVMETDPSQFRGVDHPVDSISWNDAKAFCEKLNEAVQTEGLLPEGYKYALPTEAQWEYACRAGTTTALNNGKDLSDEWDGPEIEEVGWYLFNSGAMSQPVGQKQPNAWGLYDMHGNVFEWCTDWFANYPSGEQTDPTGAETGENKVMRGGSWDSVAGYCRSAFRRPGAPDVPDNRAGLRLILVKDGAGQEITIPLAEGVELEIVEIKPGTFIMGSPEDELGRYDNETRHEVTLTSGYWLGKYEVTQAQYEAIMGTNPSYFKGADLPVGWVNWYDAMEFCAKLTVIGKASGKLPEGYEFTLPTEAQWEYACRAGTTTALNSGKNLSDTKQCPEMDEVGWYKYNGDLETHPVGLKKPNAWGLYDMHGNVLEWCLDWYGGDYPALSVTDPKGSSTGERRVIRGGSWYDHASDCRSANRLGGKPNINNYDTGFRVALVSVPPPSGDMTIPLSEGVELEIVEIKAGTFIMGSPEDEPGRGDWEVQHQVTLTQDYWMGQYEVTQAQYEAVMGSNPSEFKGADRPVEKVSWYDAMEFCSKLTGIAKASGKLPEGYEFTLPTEAQWEYACRAGTTTALNSGKNLSDEEQCPEMDEVGWYGYNSGYYDSDGNWTYNGKTFPVGQKQPNAWGLYDMHGNVYEWCLDWDGDYPTSSVTDPTGPSTGSARVIRGGGYRSYARHCRSANRVNNNPSDHGSVIGIRVALVPVPPSKDMTIPLAEGVDLEIVWVEPGTFMMGSPEDELGRYDNETQHEVTLTREYWLGQYEVTQAQYEAVTGKNPSNWKGADLPVEQVTWDEAMEFCAKLTEMTREAGTLPEGYEFTLPTEAQWEYACRAGTTTAFNNGTDIPTEGQRWNEPCPNLDEVGWYWYNGGEENFDQGLICTHPGGQKQPNSWGLYDMHGNVLEWCLDWSGDYPASSVTNPKGPDTGSRRVLRGGAWLGFAYSCRSAFRDSNAPGYRHSSLGFRVALVSVSKDDMTIPLAEGVDLDMIWIKPGTFIMGSPEDELGRYDNETRHEVTLTSGYWLGKYEVTQAQYEAVMGTNPSNWKGADLPVEQVSWDDAMEFCKKLTAKEKAAGRLPEGYEYTLPTEAQWEYACRAGTTTALNSGKNLSAKYKCPEMDEVGWYGYNSGQYDSAGNYTDNGKTFPVGQKQPNAWGLYDMHGNVWEWCLDRYGNYPTSAVTDPTGASTGSYRVLRGGSWLSDADGCRSASRDYINPGDSYGSFGFRVALAPVQ